MNPKFLQEDAPTPPALSASIQERAERARLHRIQAAPMHLHTALEQLLEIPLPVETLEFLPSEDGCETEVRYAAMHFRLSFSYLTLVGDPASRFLHNLADLGDALERARVAQQAREQSAKELLSLEGGQC